MIRRSNILRGTLLITLACNSGLTDRAAAQLSNLTIHVADGSPVLDWAPVADVDEYVVHGWNELLATKYWMGQPGTNFYRHNNALNSYSQFFYQVQPVVAAPVSDPPPGTYFTPQSVSITCRTPGATIYYTTNGSLVSTNSPVYEGPIEMEASRTLRTLAGKDGYYPKAGYSQYTVLSPLLLWYPFNGNAQDESYHKNDGIAHGAVLCPDRAGTADRAYAFDGDSSYIEVGQEPPFDLVELTVTAVVRMNAMPAQGEAYCVVSKGDGYGCFYLSLERPGGGAWPPYAQLVYNHRTAGGNFVTADYTTHFYTNQFYHVALTRTATQIKLYVDGVARATTDYATPPLMNNSPVWLGKGPDAAWPNAMNGVIDNVRVFSRALSLSEIQAVRSEDY